MNELSKLLARLRLNKSATLRDVEAKTGISNAYLCQLENGDVSEPSPRILQKLSKYYEFPYTDLLIAAGYMKKTEKKRERENELLFMSQSLSDDQYEVVKKFMEYLKNQKEEEAQQKAKKNK